MFNGNIIKKSPKRYDGFGDNFMIEEEADLIIDFSEKNPFGTP